jgi:membrane-associated phospholipid phosphatase
MSPSVALEYGFPSTHSTNSISVALFLISMACEKLAPESPARMITTIACTFYAVSVVFGRVYCGMHTVKVKKKKKKKKKMNILDERRF